MHPNIDQQPTYEVFLGGGSANVQHATAVRAELRAVLWQAAVAGKLDGLNAQLEHLGARAGEEIDLGSDSKPVTDDDSSDLEAFEE